MSGPIRQKMGPITRHLKERLDGLAEKSYDVPPQQVPSLSLEAQEDLIESLLDDLESDLIRIGDWSDTLAELDQQWQALIAQEEDGAEATAYQTFVAKNDYTALMITGHAQVTELQNKRRKLERALNRIKASISDRDNAGAVVARPLAAPSAQLPKLGLRYFNGNYKDWLPWKGWFKVTILDQPIPPLTQFLYLVACMEKGSLAEAALAPIEIIEKNLPYAMKTLEENFGDLKRIIRSHWRTLQTLKPLFSNKTTNAELRKAYETIALAVNQLEQANEDIEGRSVQILVQQKWPPRIIEKILDKEAGATVWNTTQMLKSIDEIIRRQEEVRSWIADDESNNSKTTKPHTKISASPTKNSSVSHEQPYETSALFVGENTKQNVRKKSKKKYEKKGPYCILDEIEGHWTNECPNHKTDESKKKKLKEKKRCPNCTSPYHLSCEKKMICSICKQVGHHRIFHREDKNSTSTKARYPTNMNLVESQEVVHTGTFSIHTASEDRRHRKKMLYMVETLVFNLKNPEKVTKVLIVLDSGAEQSFISQKVVDLLNIDGPMEKLNLSIFGTKQTIPTNSKKVQVWFKTFDDSNMKLEFQTIDFMMRPIRTVLIDSETDLSAKILEPRIHYPDVLIGIDNYNEVTIPMRTRLPSKFWKQSTLFGPVVGGKGFLMSPPEAVAENLVGIFNVMEAHMDKEAPLEPKFENLIKHQYEIDKLGIVDSPAPDADEIEAEKILKANLKFLDDGRIEVPLLWKQMPTKAHSQKGLAYGRFLSELKKLKKNPDLLRMYDQNIKDYLKNGICGIAVPRKDEAFEVYLPHHGVTKESSMTTKIRKVNDASASTGGPSLNDLLYKGPSRIPDAAGFVMRFRKPMLVIIMDIEKAFLQLRVRPCDRKALRFFWVENIELDPTPENTIILEYHGLPFGVICAPSLMDSAIEFLMDFINTAISQEIKENTYVDNVALSGSSTEEILEKYREAKRIFASAKMTVREFLSNDVKVNQKIPAEERIKNTTTKVLGVSWNSVTDQLKLQLVLPSESERVTKRNVMRAIAKCYDPLGYMIPVLLKSKIFCQSLWESEYDWDQEVDPKKAEEWRKLVQDWPKFEKNIDRRITGSPSAKYQLHGFCDASSEAYATAVILRVEEPSGQENLANLIFAKGHLKPVKGMTIPRMELMGLLIGSRAIRFAETQLRMTIDRRILWTDSTAVLGWLASEKKQKVFIERRLVEIRNCRSQCRHVASEYNVADCATRGLEAEELVNFDRWWHGPKWLVDSEENWPKNEFVVQPEDQNSEEVETEPDSAMVYFVNLDTVQPFPIEVTRFSSLSKLLRTMVYVLRWRKIAKNGHKDSRSFQLPTPKDFKKAMNILVKRAQVEHPPDEKQVQQLGIRIDEKTGLLKCYGRLGRSTLSETAKNPIFLPRNAVLTKLVVLDTHQKLLHSKTSVTLAELREEYWIPQGRRSVNQILKQGCHLCKRYDAVPFSLPMMPSLPPERTTRIKPLEISGVDFFGPLQIRKGDQRTKIWGVIFTCLVTRLTVIEIASDLTAHTFVQVLLRVISNYGKPKKIYSDNATNFKLAQKSLELAWKELGEPVEWEYVTSHSPWSGGYYEVMVKLTKGCLRRTIGRSLLDYNSMVTLFAQTQAVLNSRPLTYMSEDLEDQRVIRPIDFINFGVEVTTPTLNTDGVETFRPEKLESREKLVLAIEKEEKFLNKLWIDFREHYLKSLREKHRQFHQQSKRSLLRSPTIGEVVLIQAETPRAEWRMGRVVSYKRSHDGEIRAVMLKTQQGQLERPVSLIYPLEIPRDSTETVIGTAGDPGSRRSAPTETTAAHPPQTVPATGPAPNGQENLEYRLRPRRNRNTNMFFFMVTCWCFGLHAVEAITNIRPVTVECSSHGINVVVTPGVTQIVVCILPYCYERRLPSHTEYFGLPTEVLLYKQTIKTRYWVGPLEYQTVDECPAKSFCEVNDCFWCPRFLLYTLQCLPWWLEAMLGILLILTLALFFMFIVTIKKFLDLFVVIFRYLRCFFGTMLTWFFMCLRWILAPISRRSRRFRSLEEVEEPWLPFEAAKPPIKRKRRDWVQFPILRRSGLNMLLFLVVVCRFEAVEGREPRECSEVVPLTVSQNRCYRTDHNSTRCEVNEATIINIPPRDQTACLLLRDPQHHPMGTLKLRFHKIRFECTPIVHHYSRRIELKDVSTKLCPRDGSCVGEFCAKIKPHELAPEFNGFPNSRPGYTYCSQGCSSWLLCGCTFPTSACILYRIYAEEVLGADTMYTIFSCDYDERVLVQGEFQQNFESHPNGIVPAETRSYDFDLETGVPMEKGGIQITLVNQLLPPDSVRKSFVSNGTHIALLNRESYEESKLFQCGSIEDVWKMRCTFPQDASRCTAAEGKANCAHKKFVLDQILEKDHLPIAYPKVIFKPDQRNKVPIIEFLQDTSLTIVVQMKLQMESVIDLAEAKIEFLGIQGCAGCPVGAEFKLVCQTNYNTIVHVQCETIHFSIQCRDSKEPMNVHVAIRKTLFNETCEARWPGGSYTGQVVAELHVAELDHLKNLEADDPNQSSIRRFGRSYYWLWSWIWSTWWYQSIVLFVGLGALILVFILWWCPCLCDRRRSHQD